MNNYKKAGIIGGLLVMAHLVISIYQAFAISKGFSFIEGLLPELKVVVINAGILLAPATVLIFKKFKKESHWLIWTYPVIVGLGLLSVYMATDALAAGLPMIIIVFPFCIIFAIVTLIKK
jgi:uncharacterized membrane protein